MRQRPKQTNKQKKIMSIKIDEHIRHIDTKRS